MIEKIMELLTKCRQIQCDNAMQEATAALLGDDKNRAINHHLKNQMGWVITELESIEKISTNFRLLKSRLDDNNKPID